jgi:hypothetical protein
MDFLRRTLRQSEPQPDRPQPFGYKRSWYTLGGSDPLAVAQFFALHDIRPCSWDEGLKLASSQEMFIAPPLQGWMFVLGEPLDLSSADTPGALLTPLLEPLSATFGVAHYFATQRVVEYHVWARAERGLLVRGYAYLGERGETLWDVGDPSAEDALGLHFFDERSPAAQDERYWERDDLVFPSEESVMQLARHWCIAPVDLVSSKYEPALGLYGRIPT